MGCPPRLAVRDGDAPSPFLPHLPKSARGSRNSSESLARPGPRPKTARHPWPCPRWPAASLLALADGAARPVPVTHLGAGASPSAPAPPGRSRAGPGWGRRIGGVPEAWERCRGESLQVQRRPAPTYSHVPEEETEAQDTAGWDRKRERVAGCLQTRPTAPQTLAFLCAPGHLSPGSRLGRRAPRLWAPDPGVQLAAERSELGFVLKMGCRGKTERGSGARVPRYTLSSSYPARGNP